MYIYYKKFLYKVTSSQKQELLCTCWDGICRKKKFCFWNIMEENERKTDLVFKYLICFKIFNVWSQSEMLNSFSFPNP